MPRRKRKNNRRSRTPTRKAIRKEHFAKYVHANAETNQMLTNQIQPEVGVFHPGPANGVNHAAGNAQHSVEQPEHGVYHPVK